MLTIILGFKDEEKYLEGKKFVDYNDGLFDDMYEEDWLQEHYVREVLKEIDHIDLSKSNGTAFHNFITGNNHSHKELSTGAKTLILMYKFPNVVFQARFGGNCTDLLEKLASQKDITIKDDYFHAYSFKYINEINYINYNYIARNKEDVFRLLPRFLDEHMIRFESDEEDDTDSMNRNEFREYMRIKHPNLYEELIALEEEE